MTGTQSRTHLPNIVYADANAGSVLALSASGMSHRLEELGRFQVHMGVPANDEEYLHRIGDAEILLLGGTLPDGVLVSAPQLKMISYLGQGVANFVNLPAARQRGIRVGITPNYGAISVSEHTLALLFAVARRIVPGDNHIRQNRWRPFEPGVQLHGKTAGIVGFGPIAQRTASLLHGLGLNVLVWTRNPPPEKIAGVTFVDLRTLFTASHVVSLHLALNRETNGIITEELLGLLQKNSILVNTARAELIAENALEEKLSTGHLFAGLDVFRSEPLESQSLFRELPNVVLSPHQGYNTPEAFHSLLVMAVENINNFINNQTFNEYVVA